MRALGYFIEEAVASLWRGRGATALALATITAALFVVGAFLVVTANVERLVGRWAETAEISVYLDDGVSAADRTALQEKLQQTLFVASVAYISKPQALDRFKRDFPDLSPVVTDLGTNPFPASYEVRVRAAGPEEVERLGRDVREMPGVADVRYDRRWMERLLAVIGIIRLVGFALGAVLVVAAGLTVANVIRLALYARADEIEIMRLVGAPVAYIRGPFITEGILQGGIGALLALLALRGAHEVLLRRYFVASGLLMSSDAVVFLRAVDCASLVAGGVLLGCVGGLVASRDDARAAGDRAGVA